MECKIAKKK